MVYYSLDESVDVKPVYNELIKLKTEEWKAAEMIASISCNFTRPGDMLLKYEHDEEKPSVSAGLDIVDNGRLVKSSSFGFVHYGKDSVELLPFIFVNKEKTAGYMVMPSLTKMKRPFSLYDVMSEVERNSFRIDFDKDSIREGFEKGKKGGGSIFTFVQGRPEKKSLPEDCELDNNQNFIYRHSVGCDPRQFSFFNFSSLPTVKQGAVLGKLTKSRQGIDGEDVYGNPISSKAEERPKNQLGMNTLKDYNRGAVISKTPGLLQKVDRTVSVVPYQELNGGLNSSISANQALLIHGNVASDVQVESKNAIIVLGHVGSSLIKSDVGVFIFGKIAGGKSGARIISSGDVYADSAENVAVSANGWVAIRKEARNCRIRTNGAVNIYSDNGKIAGGRVDASLSVSAAQVGEQGLNTIIALGDSSAVEKKLQNYISKIMDNETMLKKFLSKLGPSFIKNPAKYLSSISPDKLETAKMLIAEYRNTAQEQRILRDWEVIMTKYIAFSHKASLKIESKSEGNVKLVIAKQIHDVKPSAAPAEYTYDFKKKKFVNMKKKEQ